MQLEVVLNFTVEVQLTCVQLGIKDLQVHRKDWLNLAFLCGVGQYYLIVTMVIVAWGWKCTQVSIVARLDSEHILEQR